MSDGAAKKKGSYEVLTVIEWGLPFPSIRYTLVYTPQDFMAVFGSKRGGGKRRKPIVATHLHTARKEKIAIVVPQKGGRAVISRVGVRVEPLSLAEKVIFRPDHVVVPVQGVSLYYIEEVEPTTELQRGFVKGKDVPILVEDSADLAPLVDKVDAVVKSLGKALDFSEQLNQMAKSTQLGVFLAQDKESTHDISAFQFNFTQEVRTALRECSESIVSGNIIAAAGYIYLSLMLFTVWSEEDVLETLVNLMESHPQGIPAYAYVNNAIDAATRCAAHIQELQTITERIQENELRQVHIAGLRRIQDEVRERLRELEADTSDEISRIKARLKNKKLPPDVEAYVTRELTRLESPYTSFWAETEVLLKHINFLLDLPWYERAEDIASFEDVVHYLDRHLYGLRRAKEAVLDYLAVLHHTQGKGVKGLVMCFVGPPGTGKTDMGRRIAEALKRPFYKISLGGVSDEAEIKGHRRTYVGALPGSIAKALSIVKVKNPVILLDEVDKMSVGLRGDPAAALMEALDPEFNHAFYDHFVDFPIDLSEVLFICSANVEENIPAPLRDRMQIIQFRPYTAAEKFVIGRDYILRRIQRELAIERLPHVTADAIRSIISLYTFESGVRELYRLLRKVIMRGLRLNCSVIDVPQVDELLWDEPKMVWRYYRHADFGVGATPTLGVGSDTGEGVVDVLMFKILGPANGGHDENNVEAGGDKFIFTFDADGITIQTVKLAVLVARSLISAPPKSWLIFQTNPTIKTVGTSLGVSAVLGALSALTEKLVHPDWVFTGEIDCFGNIHPVGGLATKIATAEMQGYKRIYIPKANEHDLLALDFEPTIEVRCVSHIKEILNDGALVTVD